MNRAMERFGTGVRFYGGHIHLGVTDWPEDLPKFVAVRLIDLLFGMGYLRHYSPHPNDRDEFYGLPGLYRETPYGLEYRTLGNEWVKESPTNPKTFNRALFVANLIKHFEINKDALIKLYNSVNWAEFEDTFRQKNWSDMMDTLGDVVVDKHGSTGIELPSGFVPVFGLSPVSGKMGDKPTLRERIEDAPPFVVWEDNLGGLRPVEREAVDQNGDGIGQIINQAREAMNQQEIRARPIEQVPEPVNLDQAARAFPPVLMRMQDVRGIPLERLVRGITAAREGLLDILHVEFRERRITEDEHDQFVAALFETTAELHNAVANRAQRIPDSLRVIGNGTVYETRIRV